METWVYNFKVALNLFFISQENKLISTRRDFLVILAIRKEDSPVSFQVMKRNG